MFTGWFTEDLGRLTKFRQFGAENTLENYFKNYWNENLNHENRIEFSDVITGPKDFKNFQKKDRFIDLDLQNIADYLKYAGKKSWERISKL